MGGLSASNTFDFTSVVRKGDFVAWPQGTGEPTGLTSRLMAQARELPRPTLVLGMVTSSTLDYPGTQDFDFLCLNGAGNTRKAVAMSANRVVPAHLSSIPGLIKSGAIKIDMALVRVRPTPDPLIFSLGVMVDFVHEMIDVARVVVAEIDERMPITSGDTLVPRNKIGHFTIADGVEPLIADVRPDNAEEAVAHKVAELIPDRATVQFGIGALPVAVSKALATHKDLGLHSGVISDAVLGLLKSGAINNRCKGVDQGVSVTGGLFGTRELFEFAHQNDAIQLRRVTYTHAASTLAQVHALHSINSAIAVDLTGQVNAESVAGRYLGAVGGYVDFVRGARLSLGGRSIVALTSTTPDGRNSKIVANLRNDTVTVARSDADLVVTEYGVADLWGLDLIERAKALTRIAHPRFRDELAREAGIGATS